MPASPLVSVVIPAKDRNVDVQRAISSALHQTVNDLEVIVVDDGSAEPLEAAVASSISDARVRFHRNDSATGPSAARNVGTGLARGSFVAYLDSDDEWHPAKLERQLRALQRRDRDAGLSLCGYEVVNGSRRRARVPQEVRAGDVVDLLDTRHEPTVTSCFVLPRALAQRYSFDGALAAFEDLDVAARVSISHDVVTTRSILVRKYVSGDRQFSGPRIIDARRALLAKHATLLSEHPAVLARNQLTMAAELVRAGRTDEAAALLASIDASHSSPWMRMARRSRPGTARGSNKQLDLLRLLERFSVRGALLAGPHGLAAMARVKHTRVLRRRRRARRPGPLATICMFGHFAPAYVRNRQVVESLTSLGVSVVQAQQDGPVFRRWPRLARDARGVDFDAIWVAFLGYSDVPLAWVLSRRRRVPLVFDAFVLLHDTFVTDRATVRKRSPAALFLRVLETVACHLADIVVIDTVDHAERLAQRVHLDPAWIRVLHVGSDHDEPCRDRPATEPFTVAFYGSFMPLHGVDTIVRAAALLEDEREIRFVLIGDGQTKAAAVELARTLGGGNIVFLDPLHGTALRDLLCDAEVLLGVFGTSAKAMVVVPNKVVDALALEKPVVTAATPAIRRILDPSQIAMVPPGDPQALAGAILALHSDPAAAIRLASAGRRAYEDHFSGAARRLEMAAILQAAQP